MTHSILIFWCVLEGKIENMCEKVELKANFETSFNLCFFFFFKSIDDVRIYLFVIYLKIIFTFTTLNLKSTWIMSCIWVVFVHISTNISFKTSSFQIIIFTNSCKSAFVIIIIKKKQLFVARTTIFYSLMITKCYGTRDRWHKILI